MRKRGLTDSLPHPARLGGDAMSGRAARASKARKRERAATWRQRLMATLLDCAIRMRSSVAPIPIDWLQYPQYEPKRGVRTVVSFYVVPEKAP